MQNQLWGLFVIFHVFFFFFCYNKIDQRHSITLINTRCYLERYMLTWCMCSACYMWVALVLFRRCVSYYLIIKNYFSWQCLIRRDVFSIPKRRVWMERVQLASTTVSFFLYNLYIFLDICVDLLDFQIRPSIYFFFVINLSFFY